MHLMSEPMPKLKFTPAEIDIRFGCPSHPAIEGSSKWDQITIQGPRSIKEIAEEFKQNYQFSDVEFTIYATMDMFSTDAMDEMELNMSLAK